MVRKNKKNFHPVVFLTIIAILSLGVVLLSGGSFDAPAGHFYGVKDSVIPEGYNTFRTFDELTPAMMKTLKKGKDGITLIERTGQNEFYGYSSGTMEWPPWVSQYFQK